MKFTNILKNIILEASRSALLYDKYVKPTDKSKKGVMTFEDFLRLIYTDPTTRPENVDLQTTSVNDLESIHPGKYSQWILNIFNNPKLTDDDFMYLMIWSFFTGLYGTIYLTNNLFLFLSPTAYVA
jgi:hypothetical protein